MVEAGSTVGRWRAFIEDPGLIPCSESACRADGVIGLPALQAALFEVGEVEIWVNGTE
jgi:hypothetical protein